MVGKIVAISGHFDPFHEGHLDHLIKASMMGDFLIVIVNTDEAIIRKRTKSGEKPVVNSSIYWRMEIIRILMKGLGIRGMVVPSVDDDESVAKSLEYYHPHIFAKGGDRSLTVDPIPDKEVLACHKLSIDIIYGVGGKLNGSSKMKVNKELQ
jgi:D-beta-D-heptose 7-phosphate kinase/D-beta-D-heptose 1-phosphate adenosyltransferase